MRHQVVSLSFIATPFWRKNGIGQRSPATCRFPKVLGTTKGVKRGIVLPLVATSSQEARSGVNASELPNRGADRLREAVTAREAAFLAVEQSLMQNATTSDVEGTNASTDSKMSRDSPNVGHLSQKFLLSYLALWSEARKPSRAEYALAKIISFNAVRQRMLFDYVLQTNVLREREAMDSVPRRIKSDNLRLSVSQRALLHTALAQYAFMERVPVHTIVFSTVELAKTYYGQRFASFVNAILRNLARYGEKWMPELERRRPAEYIVRPLPFPEDNLNVRYSYPGVFVAKVANQLMNQERVVAFLEAGNLTPQIFFRIPCQFTDTAELRAALEIGLLVPWDGSRLSESAARPWNIYRVDLNCADVDGAGDLVLAANTDRVEWAHALPDTSAKDLFQKLLQKFIVQNVTQAEHIYDLCEQLRARWNQRRRLERVLDLCTAPGGKLTAVFEYLQKSGLGDLLTEYVGVDLNGQRLQMVHENIHKAPGMSKGRVFVGIGRGESFVEYQSGFVVQNADDRSIVPSFDLVIADVPCTNSGVLNRRPEARWRLSERDFATAIPRLISLQTSLLTRALRLSRHAVFYMTCSILEAEGSGLVRSVLEQFPEFELSWERLTYTDTAGRDGGYAALLWRQQEN
ncbi:hypothetical protein CCYA_CCYA03G0805 [Cyanidiococcus yangmingshanensis]|nr:hypothetical protein CCYA_CCYA03G0805 [Cyanidiococcus yangmingshanensis]